MSTVQTDTEVLSGLAERLKAAMERLGMSQRQLAKITEDPLMTINNVVNGRNMPGSGVLSRIAEAVECTTDHLLYGTPNPPKKKSRRAS